MSSEEGDAIQVFVRVRPDGEHDGAPCLTVDNLGNSVVMQCKPEEKVFTFDTVADANVTQEAVFGSVAKRLIESCISGYNATILAYGQTGSGKTFTMLGPSEEAENFQHEQRGIIPRSFEHLFNLINRHCELNSHKVEFLCKCSFLEIYNEQVFDLLDTATVGLHLRENMKRGVYVEGIDEMAVVNANEAYQVLIKGWQNRSVASTSMNRESSRSHAVFTIQVESKETKGGIQNIRQAQLNLVDLAGSERQKDTRVDGQRLKEASSINKSLSALGNVIMALVDVMNGKNRHVPYRDSKLTFLLRDSLGGNAKTCMVACIQPGSRYLGETLSTLQFARRAKMIRNKAVVNEDTLGNIIVLQAEIRKLKEQLGQYQFGQTTLMTPAASADSLALENPNGYEVAGNTSCANVDEWKNCFLNSVVLVEKSEREKSELELRITAAENMCIKQEKFLQSTKMIVKFRENCIRRLESGKQAETRDEAMDELKEEINQLRSQLELNPALAKYAAENKHLKNEVQRLLTSAEMADARQLSLQRREHLEALYRELAQSLPAAGAGEEHCGHYAASSEPGIPHAALEKCKDQIQALLATIDNLKLEAACERECASRKTTELECELVALRRSYGELETVLAARQLQTRLDRDAAGEAHMQTLRGIATPKKSPAPVTVAAMFRAVSSVATSPMLPMPVDFDEHECQEDSAAAAAMESAAKDVAMAAAAEALAEQIRTLQLANDELHEKIDALESEGLKERQQVTRLEHMHAALQQASSDKGRELNELNKHISSLSSEKAAKIAANELLQSEVEDLRILLKAADRELAQSKAAHRASLTDSARLKETLETKLVKINCELSSLQTQHSEVVLEKTGLQEALEAVHIMCSFHEGKLHDVQEHLAQADGRAQHAEADLQGALSRLDAECHRSSLLLSQARDDKDQELLDAAERCRHLSEETEKLSSKLRECSGNLAAFEKQNDLLRAECTSLKKDVATHKESAAKLATRVQEQRASMALQQESADALARDGADKAEQLAGANTLAAELMRKSEELRKQLDALARSAELRDKKHDVEMTMMKDEYDAVSAECQRLEAELARTTEALEKTQITVEQKNAVLSTMQEAVERRARAVDDLITEHAAELMRLQCPQQGAVTVEAEELRAVVAGLERDNESYRCRQAALGTLLEELEWSREEKNEELILLRARLADSEKSRSCAEHQQASRVFTLEEQVALLRAENESRRGESVLHAKEAAAALAACHAAEKGKDQALAEQYKAYGELSTLQTQVKVLLEEKIEDQSALERLRNLSSRDHQEMMNRKSELEQAK